MHECNEILSELLSITKRLGNNLLAEDSAGVTVRSAAPRVSIPSVNT